ncbi:NADPH:quinone oxidoreductase family protein [Rhodococcus rhodochrous]|uniref:NADPH:quinone oxidoreductase family protein n=1 Tax=Rhodococcus rhodochrous TaxID=1829 RepID=UPI000D06BE1F|nr:NADPH:quinone oxidoreductase family protein [Rhodococcus rhodochrous]AYA24081.1 NADPH:quinone oxidoreductase family protein [Rhodococcus rhodochrous]
MKAVVVSETNGPEGMELREVPEPDHSGKVLIDVAATGVSFPDLLMTRGEYQLRPELPFVSGAEVAGTVLAAPSGAACAVGDRVMAVTTLGGFAERVAIDPSRVLPLPPELSFAEGAAMVMNYLTAEFALSTRAVLRAGETVVVLGAGGGIGAAAIQIARSGGARVIAVVRRAGMEQHLHTLGADHVVALGEGWTHRVAECAGGVGVDVVVDPVGGPVFDEALRVLSPGGRFLVIGFAAGSIPTVKVNRLLLRNISVAGVAFGAWVGGRPDELHRLNDSLREHVRRGLRPSVGESYELAEVPAVLSALAEGRVRGKAVVVQK